VSPALNEELNLHNSKSLLRTKYAMRSLAVFYKSWLTRLTGYRCGQDVRMTFEVDSPRSEADSNMQSPPRHGHAVHTRAVEYYPLPWPQLDPRGARRVQKSTCQVCVMIQSLLDFLIDSGTFAARSANAVLAAVNTAIKRSGYGTVVAIGHSLGKRRKCLFF